MNKVLGIAILIVVSIGAVSQAVLVNEATTNWNNQIDVPLQDTSYTFSWILNSDDLYWEDAQGVAIMENNVGISDSNSGVSSFRYKVRFSQAITSFTFTTPQHVNMKGGGAWSYSTNGTDYTVLKQYTGDGSTAVTYVPVTCPEQTFEFGSGVSNVWIQWESDEYYMGVAQINPPDFSTAYMKIEVLAESDSTPTGFIYESTSSWGNQLDLPEFGGSYEFSWLLDSQALYWDRATGVSFDDKSVKDANTSVSTFGFKVKFTKPVSSFQFTTPRHVNLMGTGEWSYSTNGTDFETLYAYDAGGTATIYAPVLTPEQTFAAADNVTEVWFHWDADETYMGNAQIYDGATAAYMKIAADAISAPLNISAEIVSMTISSDVVELVVASDWPEYCYPKYKADLTDSAWSSAGFSTNGLAPFVVTNLGYAAASGSNYVIYVEASESQRFFKLGAE